MSSSASPTSTTLKSNAIGLLGAATLGMVFLSPAMTLYGLFGPIYLACGKAAPMSFVIALLATLPTAFSYAVLSRDFPTSGSTADWTARAAGHRTGVWAGWLVFLYYFTNFIIQIVAAGLFFNELLVALGMALPPGAGFVAGVFLGSAWPAWMVYHGVSVSAKGALIFLLLEITTVAVLCATVVWVAPSHGTPIAFDGFSPAATLRDSSGMFRALVFAMLGFCGFDVISTLAEETRTARKLIPQATILALMLYAVLIVAGMWALTLGGDAAHLKAVAESGRMPITEVAQNVWGRGSILITLTALTATLALIIATSVGASRILFAKGRRAAAPAVFARLHPRFQTPWTALHFIFTGGLVGTFVTFASLGSYKAYEWWCNTSVFFAVLTFFFGNLAVILLNRERLKTPGGLLLFGLVPTLGIAVDLYILVQSFFVALWSQDWATGKSVVVFGVACAALALVPAMITNSRRGVASNLPAGTEALP